MGRGGGRGAPLFGLTAGQSEQFIMATSNRNHPRAPLFGLVDVNNFYVSCERAFNPRLANVPVVVLSNNDGCAVARSNEVKALGVKMGAPWFQMKELARQHGIVALSSNYTLYGDMSNRVVSILREFSPDIEVYSIDESFLRVETVDHLHGGATSMGQAMRHRIRQWTSLPVCAGFGESKTLAKFANHLAKKNPVFDGVCDLTALTYAQRQQWMTKIEVGEVWGVGRKIAARLQTMGIRSVLDLATADLKLIRRQFGVSLERIRELLHGEQAPVPPRARAVGSVEVRSHLMVADGVDLVIEPGRAGLSPEQVRQFIKGVMAVFAHVSGEGRASTAEAQNKPTKGQEHGPA